MQHTLEVGVKEVTQVMDETMELEAEQQEKVHHTTLHYTTPHYTTPHHTHHTTPHHTTLGY